MKYKYSYIDEVTKDEVREVMTGEHGKCMQAWTSECVNAGYRKGLAIGAGAAIVGTVITFVVKEVRDGVLDKCISRSVDSLIRKMDVTKH